MDPDDGKELPLMYKFEAERQRHIAKYGSFLYCPEHDTLCSSMEKTWETGCSCSRKPCILEDPEDIALKERQARTREKRKLEEEKKRDAGIEEESAPIRTQTKTRRDLMLEKIQRLEKESENAYRRNMPRIGESKLYEAMKLRRQLRREESKDV